MSFTKPFRQIMRQQVCKPGFRTGSDVQEATSVFSGLVEDSLHIPSLAAQVAPFLTGAGTVILGGGLVMGGCWDGGPIVGINREVQNSDKSVTTTRYPTRTEITTNIGSNSTTTSSRGCNC